MVSSHSVNEPLVYVRVRLHYYYMMNCVNTNFKDLCEVSLDALPAAEDAADGVLLGVAGRSRHD